MNLFGAGINIVVGNHLPPNTIAVSPDLFEQMKGVKKPEPVGKEGK